MALEQLLKKNKEVLLFYCMESEALARKVAHLSDSIKLQSINWRYHLPTIRKNPIENNRPLESSLWWWFWGSSVGGWIGFGSVWQE
ncbi:hypothetical protein Sjap_004925 [Stephania japonica]|uniref:Uncharacterized protein n=1 Tax=Stephania japonica TaxID=461633 RepID=A0AAP0K5D7_9MAGN